MGILNLFFKKAKPVLNPEDNAELREIERKTYLEEAKKIVAERGKQRAKSDLEIKKDIYS